MDEVLQAQRNVWMKKIKNVLQVQRKIYGRSVTGTYDRMDEFLQAQRNVWMKCCRYKRTYNCSTKMETLLTCL